MSHRERIGRRLSDPEEKRRYVRSLFAGIAGRYDLTNDVMSLGLHRRWKRRLLELADPPPGGRVLDLAAGTGDLAIAAARRVEGKRAAEEGDGREPEDGTVVALDFTREMLDVGRRRPGAEAVRWVQGDALRLPFPDRAFDRVVAGYGLRNLADLGEGLAEVRRVLTPGGRLLSLDFGKPRWSLLRKAYLRYLDVSTWAVGWLLHRDPEAYLYIPESLRRHPGQEVMMRTMQGRGYVRCGYVELLLGTMAIHFGERPRRRGS